MSRARGKDLRLRKREKLMEKTQYVRVLKKGTRVSSQNFTLAFAENGLDFPRIGTAAPKKAVPSAVCRNKIKRRFREIFRLNKQKFGSNDVILMARTDSSKLPFPAVSGEILELISGKK